MEKKRAKTKILKSEVLTIMYSTLIFILLHAAFMKFPSFAIETKNIQTEQCPK